MSLSLWLPIKVNYQQKRCWISKTKSAVKCAAWWCSSGRHFQRNKSETVNIMTKSHPALSFRFQHIYLIRTLYYSRQHFIVQHALIGLFNVECCCVPKQVGGAYMHDFLTAIYLYNEYSKFNWISITRTRTVMVMPNLIFGPGKLWPANGRVSLGDTLA